MQSIVSFLILLKSITSFNLLSTTYKPTTTTTKTFRLHATIPSWKEFESLIPSVNVNTFASPSNIDAALRPSVEPDYSCVNPTLFRERHGWCPYSERVWLTLEHLNIEYDTVRIDNTGHGPRPDYYSGQTPQIRWAKKGNTQSESMDLVTSLIESYPTTSFGDNDNGNDYEMEIEKAVRAFKEIFPRNSRPSSRAAFLFSYNGSPLPRSEFERVLSDTNNFLSTTSSRGPFLCGERVSAADIAWVPFLERYAAQLPCLYDDLNPRDVELYPHLARWYDAMDSTVPPYACRIKGDASSWRKVLVMAGYGNYGTVPDTLLPGNTPPSILELESKVGTSIAEKKLWKEYISTRPHVANTSSTEAAATILRNKEAIQKDIVKRK